MPSFLDEIHVDRGAAQEPKGQGDSPSSFLVDFIHFILKRDLQGQFHGVPLQFFQAFKV